MFFRLLSRDGHQLRASDLHAWKQLPTTQSILTRLTLGQPAFESVTIPGQSHQVRIIYLPLAEDQNVIQVGYLRRDDEQFLEEYLHVSAAAVFAGLLLATSLGWFMARRAMGGVEHITETARQIGKGDFDRRVIWIDGFGNSGRSIASVVAVISTVDEGLSMSILISTCDSAMP